MEESAAIRAAAANTLVEAHPFGEALNKDLAPAQDGVAAEAAGDHQELYDPPRKREVSHVSPIPAMDTPGNCSAQGTQTDTSGRRLSITALARS